MNVKLVIEMFDIFTGEQHPFEPLEGAPFFELFLIRLIVKAPYYAEKEHQEIVLARKYRQQFNTLKYKFIKDISPIIEGEAFEKTPLQVAETLVSKLQQRLVDQFLIPGKIELQSISLAGDWLATPSYRDSELNQILEKQIFDSLEKN